MIDLPDFARLVKARMVNDGFDGVVLWGRERARNHDQQGPGTANRVVFYDGPPDDPNGTWVRRQATTKQHPRDQAGQILEWERVTIDVWAYDGTQGTIDGLDGGEEEARQYRALRALEQAVARACFYVLRAEGHLSTFLEETTDKRTSPLGRRHGDRGVMSFEIAFTNRKLHPTLAEMAAPVPTASSVVVTTAGNAIEEPTP